MKKVFFVTIIVIMLASCGGEVRKPENAINRTIQTRRPDQKVAETQKTTVAEKSQIVEEHQSYKQQVFTESFLAEDSSKNSEFTKKLDSCKNIVPKPTPFKGELLFTSNECLNLSTLNNLLVKKYKDIENAVSVGHDLIIENDNGSRICQIGSSSGHNTAQMDFFDQFYTIKDNNIVYIKSEKELASINLINLEQEIFPLSVEDEIKSIGPLTEDGLCYLFTDTEMLTYDLKSKSIIEKVKFLELPFENTENSWYPLFMPYKIYDSENDCFYVSSLLMEPESVDSANSKMLRITTIDKTRKPKTIYELSNSSFGMNSMDVSFVQSDKYVVCTMNNATYAQKGEYTVLVSIDKHTGTATELRIKLPEEETYFYLKSFGFCGSKLVTNDCIVDLEKHSTLFKQKGCSIARFFDDNFYAFGNGVLTAVNFGSIEPVWKMKFSKEAKLFSSLGQGNIVIADGNKIYFINPANPESATTFEYDINKIENGSYSNEVGFFLDESKNRIYSSQGECFGQQEPGKLYINPMKYKYVYSSGDPSALKLLKTSLLWTGDKPIQAEIKYNDSISNKDKITIDLKPNQKKVVEIKPNESAKIVCNGEIYNLVFISNAWGD